MIGVQPFLPWKIGVLILHLLAILSTCLRLEHRRRTQRLWWDDYATIIPLICEVPNMVGLWLRFRKHVPISDGILLSYINQFIYPTLNWWARISIALAVLRVTPSWTKMRLAALSMPIAFVLTWFTVTSAAIITCAVHTEWQTSKSTQMRACGPVYKITIVLTTTELIADAALILVPLHALWNVSRRPEERRLVRLVFSSSLLTAATSTFVCAMSYSKSFVGPGGIFVWLMVCYIATAISIITSNLLVLICWFRHYFVAEADPMEDHDLHITPHWASSAPTISWHCAERSTSKETVLPNGYENFNGVVGPPISDIEAAGQDHERAGEELRLQPAMQSSVGSSEESGTESNQSQSTICTKSTLTD